MPRKARLFVCVVAHHRLVAEYLLQLLSKDNTITAFVVEKLGEQASLKGASPIFVLDNSSLPIRLSECIRWLRLRFDQSKFIVLDEQASKEDIIRMFWLGIQGYLQHHDVRKQLRSAVRAVSEGEMWVPSVAQEHVQHMILKRKLDRGLLTPRENQIIELVRRRLSNKEIANALNLRESTVRWHLASIYSRLPVSSRSELEGKVKGVDSWAKFFVHAETLGN